MRLLLVLVTLIVIGAIKLPVERDLAVIHRQEHFRGVEFNLDLREKLGQLGFIAALVDSGRSSPMVFSFRHMSLGSGQNGAGCCCCSGTSPRCNRARFCFGTWRHGTWLGMQA